jgi:hypothetical protein
LSELDKGPDRLIMDGQEYGGPATTDLAAILETDGVTFLFRGQGWHGLRITRDGHYRPLR